MPFVPFCGRLRDDHVDCEEGFLLRLFYDFTASGWNMG